MTDLRQKVARVTASLRGNRRRSLRAARRWQCTTAARPLNASQAAGGAALAREEKRQ